jgi:autophagy-related protein 18
VTKLEKETRLLVACEDGFLYIYNLDSNGGECKLVRAHDLRGSLYDITELNGNESCDSTTTSIADVTEIKENILPSIPIVKTSYAEIMRGKIVEDEKLENASLCGVVADYPPKTTVQIFDDVQFPPVCQA